MSEKPKHENRGQPTKMTESLLKELDKCFAYTLTDEEACLHVGISPRTLYNYQKENPEYVQRKQALRKTPNIAIKMQLIDGIKGNLEHSRWMAVKRLPEEYSDKTIITHEGRIETDDAVKEGMEDIVKAFNEGMRQLLTKKKKDEPKQQSGSDAQSGDGPSEKVDSPKV